MEPIKKIIIASDHRGFELKEFLKLDSSIVWLDVGAFTAARSDYPVFALAAIKKMHEGHVDGVVLLCGSGNGMAIAANRFKGVFACVAWNADVARVAKQDDNCNVLVIPADYIQQEEITEIISSWLNATFKGGRYAERLALIDTFK